MSDLSDEERQKVAAMLNTIPAEDLNLIALDQKYDREWYESHLQSAKEMDRYLAEVGKVMNMCGRHDVERAVDRRRDELTQVMNIFENAIEDLDDRDTTLRPRTV